MQFFTVKGFTATPYSQVRLWDKDIFIESIEEIIAKKFTTGVEMLTPEIYLI